MENKKNKKNDITRIEDLADFQHQEYEDIDQQLNNQPENEEENLEEEFIEPLNNDERETEEQFEENLIEDQQVSFPDEDQFSQTEDVSQVAFTDEIVENDEHNIKKEDLFESVKKLSPENEVAKEEKINEEDFANNSNLDDRKPDENSNNNDISAHISSGVIARSGNPPYGIIITNIIYAEDGIEILKTLKEHQLLNNEYKEEIKNNINNGYCMISQLNEYGAIFLAHKFRSLNIQIKMGLMDEIHPSKFYDNIEFKGLVSKYNLNQNITIEGGTDIDPIENSIIATINPELDGYNVKTYLGIINSELIVNKKELLNSGDISINHYNQLCLDLKSRAIMLNANAIVGVSFQVIAIERNKFKIDATADAVVVQKISSE